MIDKICLNHQYIITIEENVILGGAGSAVNEAILSLYNQPEYINVPNILNLGIPDSTIMHGKQDEMYADIGLNEAGIKKSTLDLLKKDAASKKN